MKGTAERKNREWRRRKRHHRIRKKLRGTRARPRLVVYRSLRNIEGQLIDDDESRTLLGFSTLAREMRGFVGESGSRKVAAAHRAGRLLAERAIERGITSVVFDRGGFKYHGRVKAFADGAREGGLRF